MLSDLIQVQIAKVIGFVSRSTCERNHATVEKFEHKTMQQMSTKMQQHQVEWRRTKVMELLSKGESNQSEISRIRIKTDLTQFRHSKEGE